MKKSIYGVFAVIAIGAALFYAHRGPIQSPVAGASRNSVAPPFSLATLDGKTLELSSYRGKVVLLDFWATWCTPCRDEIPHLVEMQNKYGNDGLQIIGVSMDDGPELVREFYSKFNMNYPVVMGDTKTADQYGGVFGLPIAYLIARNGRISAKHIGATDPVVIERELSSLLKEAQ